MGFTLKIYFLGLIAFAVRPDGNEATALMVDARQDYHLSNGCPIGVHVPLLITNAASCEGADCQTDSGAAVKALFGEDSEHTRLSGAMCGGSVWVLDNADLSIALDRKGAGPLKIARLGRQPRSGDRGGMPSDPAERTVFDWVADLDQILPDAGRLDPKAVEKGLVAARLKLDSGTLSSCKLVSVDNLNVSPLAFSTLAELDAMKTRGPDAAPRIDGPTGAFTDWLVAEIRIPDCSVTIEDRDFTGKSRRSVTLSPSVCDGSGVVEAALINLPEASFADPDNLPKAEPSDCDEDAGGSPGGDNGKPSVGRHFEIFYELAECRPPVKMRPVPYLIQNGGENEDRILEAVPPAQVGSKLLQALLPAELSRGGYSRPICPVATLQDRQR